MNESECLERFGLSPPEEDLLAIREILLAEVERERRCQGQGDTDLIKLCSVQLFGAGLPEDSLLIWRAKRSSMDAGAAVEVQLLCGAGLPITKRFLQEEGSVEASKALAYILECEAEGDF